MAHLFALEIENPKTGYISIRTYPDRFSRTLDMIMLAPQPLILRPKDY